MKWKNIEKKNAERSKAGSLKLEKQKKKTLKEVQQRKELHAKIDDISKGIFTAPVSGTYVASTDKQHD
jgi:hypothetical protein